jgi:hypothetical protein
MLAIKSFRRLKRSIVGSFSRISSRAYNGQTVQHIGLLGPACPALCGAVGQPQIPSQIIGSCPAGADTRCWSRRSSRSGICGFVRPDVIPVVAAQLFEIANERILTGQPPPKGGVGTEQIVRIELDRSGSVIAGPGRKPRLTTVASLFSCERLHAISSGQLTEKLERNFD